MNEGEHSGSEEESEIKPRTVFTPVNPENFLAWKKKFDAEMAELKKKELVALAEINSRLSGRQYFEKIKNIKDVEVDLEEDEEEDDEEEGESKGAEKTDN